MITVDIQASALETWWRNFPNDAAPLHLADERIMDIKAVEMAGMRRIRIETDKDGWHFKPNEMVSVSYQQRGNA